MGNRQGNQEKKDDDPFTKNVRELIYVDDRLEVIRNTNERALSLPA
jgi:hypothetical protein